LYADELSAAVVFVVFIQAMIFLDRKSRNTLPSLEAQELAAIKIKWSQFSQTELRTEPGIVAKARVSVQWQM